MSIIINHRRIGEGERPYLVAEMSGNHNQSLERALAIVDAAARSGADAIKLQTYTADTMTLPASGPGFVIRDANSLWAGRQLHDLYREAHTPWDWHRPIMERATELGMACFSTPFDPSAVEFLEALDVPAYKIASFEVVDIPLIELVARTGKPVIISTGMASLSEIEEAVAAVAKHSSQKPVLLKCTSTYPASPSNSNVRTVPHMRAAFGCQVGLSDHTMGCGASVAAVALGATFIEKHFTLRRSDGGVDSAFSLEPDELAQLRLELDRCWESLGAVRYGGTDAEDESRVFRRSLYVVGDLRRGDRLTADKVRAIRPGFGLAPKFLDQVLGMTVTCDVAKGTPVSWDLFK